MSNKKIKQFALYWYQKAADQHYSAAQYKLGYFYEDGLGVSKNIKLAMDWYQKSADQFNLFLKRGLMCEFSKLSNGRQ